MLDKLRILRRKLRRDDVIDHRQGTEEIIFNNLLSLSSVQRATTLKNLVERVKEVNEREFVSLTEQTLEEEGAKDILNSILSYNL